MYIKAFEFRSIKSVIILYDM